MIAKNNIGNLIIISGPSGCGKGTICNELLKVRSNIKLSISDTTREPRSDEINHVHYNFISKNEFEKKINNNEYLEYAIVHNNNYYGTPKDNIIDELNKGIDIILEIDVAGFKQIKKITANIISIFIIPPDFKTLKERLINRQSENIKNIEERLKKATYELSQIKDYDYYIINDDLKKAINDINTILDSVKLKTSNIKDSQFN